jgi:cation diffusion facilitator family transporter
MDPHSDPLDAQPHGHVFLGAGHEENERKTWGVIILCGVMMLVEIVGGSMFGSLALVADGLHMSTHAGALLIAALAYTYARKHAADDRFVFGTGKLGDLAGFTSAIVLAMISILIGYEAVARFLSPVAIRFTEAIPIAVVGLVVNIVSAWMLSGGDSHGHSHGHSHSNGHDHDHSDGHDHSRGRDHIRASSRDPDYPHGHVEGHSHDDSPTHEHGDAPAKATLQDNSIRSAYVHVIADAFVSVLAITGLIVARLYGWLWMDPLAGIIGALVIANWSYRLLRDTGGILLDVCPDEATRERVRRSIEVDGDRVVDLHLWRLGPGHLGAVLAVATTQPRDASFYRARLSSFEALSHVTVEVCRANAA